MAITLRTNKGSALTYDEMDKNFSQYFYSASRSGNIMTLYYTGSTNLSGYDPSRVITVDLNPAEGTTPNLVAGGSERSIQYKAGSQLAGQPTFVYSANNYLGIGTANPGVLVEAVGTTVSPAILALTSHPTVSTQAYAVFNRGSVEVGAIGKIDGVTDNILFQASQVDSMLTIKAGTNPTSTITVNGQTANIGVGTPYPGAKLETAINGASGKTLIFGRGLDGNFNLAGKQSHAANTDGALIGSIGLDYINQENTSIRFHRGATVTGGYMSFTVKDGSTRMQLGNTGTLTLNPEVNNPSPFNVQGNAPGQNLYATIQNDGNTANTQAVLGLKAGSGVGSPDFLQLGQNIQGYGFLYQPNNQPLYFYTNAGLRMAISAGGSVAIGIGGNPPEGKFHVLQNLRLGAAKNSFTLLQSLGQEGGSAGANVLHVRDFSRRSENTTDDWYTWNHHNSIDIDGAHNIPGTNTRSWWERSPYSGSHAFGNMTTTTLKTVSGFNRNTVLIAHGDETKHPNASLSVLHPSSPSIINVGHTDVAGPHKVVISGGGVNIDYGYYLSGSTTTDVFFKTNTGTPLVGELGSNGTTVARIDGTTGTFTAVGKFVSPFTTAPASAGAAGTQGEIRITANFIYVCTQTGTGLSGNLAVWKKVALSAF